MAQRFYDVLAEHDQELRDLHHAHVRLDANARGAIAEWLAAEAELVVAQLASDLKRVEAERDEMRHRNRVLRSQPELKERAALMRDLYGSLAMKDAAIETLTNQVSGANERVTELLQEWETECRDLEQRLERLVQAIGTLRRYESTARSNQTVEVTSAHLLGVLAEVEMLDETSKDHRDQP